MVSWGQLGLRRYSTDVCFTATRHSPQPSSGISCGLGELAETESEPSGLSVNLWWDSREYEDGGELTPRACQRASVFLPTAICNSQDGTLYGSPTQLGGLSRGSLPDKVPALCSGGQQISAGITGNRSAGKVAGWPLPLP